MTLSKALQQRGIKVVAIGIGNTAVEDLLEITNGIQANVFRVDNFEELLSQSFIGSTINTACESLGKLLRLFVILLMIFHLIEPCNHLVFLIPCF